MSSSHWNVVSLAYSLSVRARAEDDDSLGLLVMADAQRIKPLTPPQRFEAKALEYLGRTYATRHPAVRIPAVLSFDQKNHLLIIQDAGDLPSLKSWLQADSPQDQITAISSALGAFLADVHNTASQDSDLRQAFNTNTVARNLSSSVYFGNLPAAAKKYGHNSQFIVEAAKAAEAQVLDADEVWTLGDFWPGNVLVSVPNEHTELSMTLVDFELAKPGTAAFDIGQMGAEMLCLARFRDSERNRLLLLEEFFRCYKARRQGSVDAAEVAIRIGAHLFTMMPKAWTAEAGEEKVKKLLREGFDLLKMGWENDEAALKNSIVRELMD